MRFSISAEHAAFGESVRSSIGDWEGPREPPLGTWWDERDDPLERRLAAVGWAELWHIDLFGACVVGAYELGRVVAPLSLLDHATLGGPLAVAGRARHADGMVAVALVEDGLRMESLVAARREPTLDGTGTLRISTEAGVEPPGAGERLTAWGVATLGYLAGLAAQALEETVVYVRTREQFGAPLADLPTLQARLADAAVLVDGLSLVAWSATVTSGFPANELLWAGTAAREVTLTAHQAHGGVGFALESGVHRAYRRAKTVQVWSTAVRRALAG